VPKKFHIDDSMVLAPAAEGVAVEVRRGPNIGKPPESAPPAGGDPRSGHAEAGRQDHHGPHHARPGRG